MASKITGLRKSLLRPEKLLALGKHFPTVRDEVDANESMSKVKHVPV